MLKSALALLVALLALSIAPSLLAERPELPPNLPAAEPGATATILINGIPGRIEVTRYRIGATNTSSSSGGGGTVGKAAFQNLVFSKPPDAASPKLLLLVANGQHISEVLLTVDLPSRATLRYRLQNVTVTGFTQGIPKEDAQATEEITLKYDQIQFEFRDGRSTTSMSWDTTANQ